MSQMDDADDIDSILLPIGHRPPIDTNAGTPASQEPDLPDEDDDVDDLLEQQLHEELLSLVKEKTFYEVLDEFVPTIPDEVTTYYLNSAGFNNPNPKLKRVVSLAVQRFISDVASDAVNYARFTAQASSNLHRIARKEPKLMLTLDDLTHSLRDYGITMTKPDYWAETSQPKAPAEKKDKTKDRVKEKRKKAGDPTASPAPKEAKIEKVAMMAPASSSKEAVKKEKKRSHKASKGDKAY